MTKAKNTPLKFSKDFIKSVPIELILSLTTCNDLNIAKLYKKTAKTIFICYNIEKYECYYYNIKTCLYSTVGLNGMTTIVRCELLNYIDNLNKTLKEEISKEYLKENIDEENIKSLMGIMNGINNIQSKIGSIQFITNVCRSYCSECISDEFIDKLDDKRDEVNFKNGIVNLQTGKFRPRTAEDYITKCLDYDYKPEVNKEAKKEIYDIFLKICNDSKELTETSLSWYGYCLTGETREQKFFVSVGHSAGNGKSTKNKIFQFAFPIYTVKIDSKTFNQDYSKRHKQMSTVKKPARFVYIEEVDKHKLDVNFLKDFVDGDKIGNNEVMYGTAEDILLYAKLGITSNSYLLFDSDSGVLRRGLMEELKNKFLEKHEMKKNNVAVGVKGFYLRDSKLEEKMHSPEFKLAFFHLLLPYCIQYYKKGLILCKEVRTNFKILCQENDKMKAFLDKNFDKTDKDTDKVHKDDFLTMYNQYNKSKEGWSIVLSDIKRVGLTYNRQARSSTGIKGCITGIKLKDELNFLPDEDEDKDDNEDDEDEDKDDDFDDFEFNFLPDEDEDDDFDDFEFNFLPDEETKSFKKDTKGYPRKALSFKEDLKSLRTEAMSSLKSIMQD